ncbi:hypothetical protein [Paenibacillus darwinianus]|nr:hypothetical protein [Paenibacillus darwinianus]
MKAILMTVMLLVTAVLLYTSIAEGENGTKAQLGRSGSAMAESIGRLSP